MTMDALMASVVIVLGGGKVSGCYRKGSQTVTVM